MKNLTVYPSRVWTFAISVSSFLMLFCSWLIGPFFIEDFEVHLVNPFLHGLSLLIPLLPIYFLFIIIAHSIISRNQSKKLIKIDLSFLAFFTSFIIGWINHYIIGLSYFSGITFFISMLIGVWYFKIDHHKVIKTYDEFLLDENI